MKWDGCPVVACKNDLCHDGCQALKKHNNPPDVAVNLTHEQATFMLKNCLANTRLCLELIMQLADEDIPIEHKQAKAAPIVSMQDRFREVMKALRDAGAKEPDDDD